MRDKRTVTLRVLLQASSSGSVGGAGSHFEPQVAVLCDPDAQGGHEAYHPQYMTEQGRWQSDLTAKATCLRDKMDILEYCKKVYPKRDITNIVESSHYLKVGSWCRATSPPAAGTPAAAAASVAAGRTNKCRTARWVKPFRCLEGPFQSDALLVPENCLFDHIHNQSKCWTFGRWNETAAVACRDRGLQLRSFAMLLPCGISLFSGVEFVCCPKHFRDGLKPKRPVLPVQQPADDPADDSDDLDELADGDELDDADEDLDGDDAAAAAAVAAEYDDDDDEEDDDVDDDDPVAAIDDDIDDDGYGTTSSSGTSGGTTAGPTASTSTAAPTPDPYFTHFDPRTEHQSYKEAQQRLEESHREKVKISQNSLKQLCV